MPHNYVLGFMNIIKASSIFLSKTLKKGLLECKILDNLLMKSINILPNNNETTKKFYSKNFINLPNHLLVEPR